MSVILELIATIAGVSYSHV